MDRSKAIHLFTFALFITACSKPGLEEKGFQVGPSGEQEGSAQASRLKRDSLPFDTRPSNVLLSA